VGGIVNPQRAQDSEAPNVVAVLSGSLVRISSLRISDAAPSPNSTRFAFCRYIKVEAGYQGDAFRHRRPVGSTLLSDALGRSSLKISAGLIANTFRW